MSKISTECVVADIAAAVNSIKHLENLLPNSKPISTGRAEYVLDTKKKPALRIFICIFEHTTNNIDFQTYEFCWL